MSAIDFATVKPGDIILSINPHDLQADPLGSLAHAYTKYIVVSANGTDSVVMANAWRASGSELKLLTKNGEGVTFESLDGHLEPGRRPSEAVLHFTEEEYISKSMDERIWAQSKLASFMSSWYNSEVAFPEEVTKAMQKALAEKAGDNLGNMNMANLESANQVMGDVIAAGEKVYRDTITANLDGMDELIQRAQEANEQVNRVARTLAPWRNDGEATTVTQQDNQGYYRAVDLHNTFRTETGVMTGSGAAYFIERITKSRAYVTNPQTGDQAGYLTRQKRAGVVLKLNTGEQVTLGQTYTVIPASTPEDVRIQGGIRHGTHHPRNPRRPHQRRPPEAHRLHPRNALPERHADPTQRAGSGGNDSHHPQARKAEGTRRHGNQHPQDEAPTPAGIQQLVRKPRYRKQGVGDLLIRQVSHPLFSYLTPPASPLHCLGIYSGIGVMMGMRSPPAGGEPYKRMRHP